jgi:hypothetical protein
MEVTQKNIKVPHDVRMIGGIALLIVFAFWMQYHSANVRVNAAPTSGPNLVGAEVTAQPLVDALEKYHADYGLYPIALAGLGGEYLPTVKPFSRFLYSAKMGEKVLKSDECKARDKKLYGWIMKDQREYQKELDQFEQDCVSGYRQFTLQSADFPQDPQARYMERWAAYDSQTKQWSLGWCSHPPSTRGRGNEIGENGVCRWREGKIPVDYSQVNQPPATPQ